MDDTTVESAGADESASALESEFKQLRQRHKARFEQLASLMSSIQSLSESAKAESDSLETLEQSAQGQLNYLKKSLEDTVTGRSDFETRIQELTEALAVGEQERAALADKLKASVGSGAELDALRTELDASRAELDASRAELDVLRAEVEGLRGELASSSMALAAAKDQLASVSTQLEEARAEASAAKERLTSLEQESLGRDDDVSALETEIVALKTESAEKDQLLQGAQSALDEVRDAQGRVQEECDRLQSLHQSAEATQEGLKTELLAVQRELESLKERYREGLSSDAALALRQQVAETAAQINGLERELAEAREHSKKSFLAQQLTDAVQESERLEEENQRLHQQLKELERGRKRMDGDDPENAGAGYSEPEVSRSPEDELLRIQRSAQKWTHGPKRVIGQILLDAGVISEAQLETALEVQKSNSQQHLGAILGELGFASEEAIAQARASQCGVEYIRIAEDTIDPEAAALINLRLATQHSCIPVSATPNSMVLAITNPMDLLAIEDVERFTNRKVDIVVGTVPDVAQAITRYYWEPE